MTAWILEDEADFVIVGTGAGGATVARVLAEAGQDVVMLEEGPWLKTDERPLAAEAAMRETMRDFATLTTAGTAPMPLLEGRLVGGSTAINSGIIWRMPEDVRQEWIRDHGLGDLVDARAQDRIFETLERELEVAESRPEVRGGNAELMERASKALGLLGKPITRNAARCRGAARCLQGCPGEARQSMDVSYVPRAVADGARIHTGARVRRVRFRGVRAIGVEGDVMARDRRRVRGRLRVHARRAVVLCAGALHSPVILRRSGLRRAVGEGFQCHPGAPIVGRFPEPVTMGFGVTQGYEVPVRAHGFKLESLTIPPELLAARIPGAGPVWQERIAELDHYAQWVTQVRMRARGTVRPGLGPNPVVRYRPSESDLRVLRESLALICRMMFAVGATEVYPAISGLPEVLTDVSQVDGLARARLGAADVHVVASHLFGGAAAGTDPSRSVVGPDLACHEADGLYVMDSSVFPTNLGANPQHSIMAVAFRAAERLAAPRMAAVARA